MNGGLIGIPAQETGRYTQFAAALAETDLPESWEVYFRYGWGVAENINACIEEMMRRDKEWFWTMGDDHAWSPGLLKRLLRRCYDSGDRFPPGSEREREIIVPLCVMRNPPYRPVIWKETKAGADWAAERDRHAPLGLPPTYNIPDKLKYERIDLKDHPDGGVIEVAAAGGAGMLIHRSVIDALGSDWFMYRESSKVGEDIYFCESAREHGFKIWCDLDSMLGHCATTVVWPVREPDGWTFAFSMMGGFHVTMPPGLQQYADECGK